MKKTKDEVQQEAIVALDTAGGSGIIANCTGSGKSRIPILIAQKEWYEGYKILICVPTEKLRDENWKKEFYKWNAGHIWESSVERTCYVSMHKLMFKYYDMVVLDEMHNITENNSVFFDQCTYKRIVALTATIPDNEIKLDIIKGLGLKIVYKVTMDEAVEWGLVSPYRITLVRVPLEMVMKTVVAGSKQRPFLQTEYDAYQYVTRVIDNLGQEQYLTAGDKARRTIYIRKRQHLIYSLQSKTNAAKWILDYIIPKEERTLIFAGSIKQAEELCVNFFHSKIDKTKKSTNHSFEQFLNQEINRLSCVDAINEGHDIPNMNGSLIVQLNSKSLKLIQRIGRSCRFREDHVAQIYMLVAMGTVDENWAHKAMKELNAENVITINFKDLKSNYYETKF